MNGFNHGLHGLHGYSPIWEFRLKHQVLFILASFCLFFPLTDFAEEAGLKDAGDPRLFFEQLKQKMTQPRSVYLEFTQERRLKLFTDPLISQGVMLMERPDQIRWETTAPYQSILLGNKKSVAQFEFSDGKWQKLKLGFPQMLQRVMREMSQMNEGKLDALMSDYKVSVSTGAVAVLTLVPKDEGVREMMSSIQMRMAVDFSASREVVMNEPNGDLTRITFHNEKRDMPFPPGTFDQSKPLDIAEVRRAVAGGP